MNESTDRMLADWLDEGPESGPREGLERALAATRRVGQRPGWTLPERWLPMELTSVRTRSQLPALSIVSLALLIVGLLAAALYLGSQRTDSAPFRNGAVVWAVGGDLFIADQLGGTPRPLVAGLETDSDPVFSSQGDRIAFVREEEDGSRIMVTRPNATEAEQLGKDLPVFVAGLRWSPDGTALLALPESFVDGVCCKRLPEESRGLYLIDIDDSGLRKLDLGSGFTIGEEAEWRPDGRHIVLVGEGVVLGEGVANPDDQAAGIYIVDADGTNLRRLPISPVYPIDLEWSPDGTRFAFASPDGPDGPFRINIADIDKSGAMTDLRQLTLDPRSSFDSNPKWSPDGSQLAIRTERDAQGRIGVVNADGSGYRIVGPDMWDLASINPIWSPDGRSLVVPEDNRGPRTPSDGAWSIDVASGELTKVQTPVDSWQRLAR